jgi:hypothetical protein
LQGALEGASAIYQTAMKRESAQAAIDNQSSFAGTIGLVVEATV